MATLIRRGGSGLLALHGLIHLMGFVAAWQLAVIPEIAYRTSVIGGAFEVGEVGARVLGILWLAAAAAVLAASWGAWRGAPWALRGTLIAAAISLAVCVLGLPDAVLGAVIDALILGCGVVVAYGRSPRRPSAVT